MDDALGNWPQRLGINNILFKNQLCSRSIWPCSLYCAQQDNMVLLILMNLCWLTLSESLFHRVLLKSPDGATKTNVWRMGCEEKRRNSPGNTTTNSLQLKYTGFPCCWSVFNNVASVSIFVLQSWVYTKTSNLFYRATYVNGKQVWRWTRCSLEQHKCGYSMW